ncbi:lipoyl(octanoyl) transferase LipB [Nocardioides sp. BP30]|uniref:lipoyl(octanoyl) transferase LipB n=1 Tax=Nocardioides sp. BP30 TaxID=3036374 RepID=UPI0024682992|nr:lipoyl(octanoyl) transferase LipB [Nocardioides sp. BP30]WGL50961.1 lipoyl(octanoyl) transferase LipB [Nocardioides sp. BP30]
MTALRFEALGTIDYLDAWELQKQVHADVVAGTRPDTVLLLEHPPTYTAGKRTDPHERPVDAGGAPVIDVDRGGKITFHGPGQLVAYPIVRLPDHVKVVDFVRRLEEAMIRTCADLGVTTARVPGRSGVWLQADVPTDAASPARSGAGRPERKIAAIGLRVSQGVTMHGVAINCDVEMDWYDRFIPCGISDAGVTSLTLETGHEVSVAMTAPVLEAHLRHYLAWEPYDATPDYEPRPEPKHGPRIALLTPSS